MWQRHKTHLANFEQTSLRVIWFTWVPLLGCRHIEMSRPASTRMKSPELKTLLTGLAMGIENGKLHLVMGFFDFPPIKLGEYLFQRSID